MDHVYCVVLLLIPPLGERVIQVSAIATVDCYFVGGAEHFSAVPQSAQVGWIWILVGVLTGPNRTEGRRKMRAPAFRVFLSSGACYWPGVAPRMETERTAPAENKCR